jgi:hypothetical protein
MKRHPVALTGILALVLLTVYWLVRPTTEPEQTVPEKNLMLLGFMFAYYAATLAALTFFVWNLVKKGTRQWLSLGAALVACLASLLLNEALAMNGLSSAGGLQPFKLAAPNLVMVLLNVLVDIAPPRGWK